MIPLVVIGGWLGAGKTTLVNALLRGAQGRRIAVLVNDFGEVSIDADLIEGAADEVLALAGGCLCCSFGADLVGTLAKVAARQPAPDVVLVECSGVGLPGAVARSAALCPAVSVQGVVVLVDAAAIDRLRADAYVGDTVRDQLAQADLLLLNQVDRVDAAAADRVSAGLARLVPGVPLVRCTRSQVPPALVLGLRPAREEADAAHAVAAFVRAGVVAALPATQRFRHWVRPVPGPVDVQALAAELRAGEPGLLRAKGLVADTDGRVWLVQAVGRRVDVAAAPPGALPGAIVCIALDRDGPDGEGRPA